MGRGADALKVSFLSDHFDSLCFSLRQTDVGQIPEERTNVHRLVTWDMYLEEMC